jgi:hypothetical protein
VDNPYSHRPPHIARDLENLADFAHQVGQTIKFDPRSGTDAPDSADLDHSPDAMAHRSPA